MSLLNSKLDIDSSGTVLNGTKATYQPTGEEKDVLQMIRHHFQLGDNIMQKPRREFNDLSVVTRTMVDEMSFNAYQPNNGDALEGDEINSWRSKAFRPIVRNKVVSIAAHATDKLIFPKIFAFNEQSDEERDGAMVMEDLMEWAANKSNFKKTDFYATLAALVAPAAITYTEYCETYRKVKRNKKDDGTYEEELMRVEELSGFQDSIIPVDQLYIENFYEEDIQKQGFLIWRRVLSHSLCEQMFGEKYPKFKEYVRPGVQLIYNDANQTFYEVYDSNMRQELDEVIFYWNKDKDLLIKTVNGVSLTDYNNPNPRNDKLYPFTKYGYETFGDGNCFYYKSLAFKMMQDANIINTLYPMIIDGTYLNLMPPMVNVGSEIISADVIIPGAVTTLSSPDADLRAIKLSENLAAGMNTLFKVEESVNQSSEQPFMPAHKETAFAISAIENQNRILLGIFLHMKGFNVQAFGKLRLGDILQYLTIPDVDKITDEPELVYKTFLLHNKQTGTKTSTRKIKFDVSLPQEPLTNDQQLAESYKALVEQGGEESSQALYKVNPEFFRQLAFIVVCSPDILQPKSDDLAKAMKLEAYDRLIQNPLADQEAVLKDFLLMAYPEGQKDAEKYITKQAQGPQGAPQDPMQAIQMAMQGKPQQAGAGGAATGVPPALAPAMNVQNPQRSKLKI